MNCLVKNLMLVANQRFGNELNWYSKALNDLTFYYWLSKQCNVLQLSKYSQNICTDLMENNGLANNSTI